MSPKSMATLSQSVRDWDMLHGFRAARSSQRLIDQLAELVNTLKTDKPGGA